MLANLFNSYNFFKVNPRIITTIVRRKKSSTATDVQKPSKIRPTKNIKLRGLNLLLKAELNKGTAFTVKERQLLGLYGLIPPVIRTTEEQVNLILAKCDELHSDLHRYIYIRELAGSNRRLLYKCLKEHVDKFLSIVYTPTVGEACLNYSKVFKKSTGLFITIKDKGHILDVLKNWPESDVKGICVTDGERILGLGDLGVNGMGISIGKLDLYTIIGGIKPRYLLPICLDVGTNNEGLLKDPKYLGLLRKRVTGEEYLSFMDEFMEACVTHFGQRVLIQFEDFALQNSFKLLNRYRMKYCTFNDDIQGTAGAALIGLISTTKIIGKKISDYSSIVFLGAGGAALGIANLLVEVMRLEGLTTQEAKDKIFMFDINGLLSTKPRKVPLMEQQKHYAKDEYITNFTELIQKVQPAVLIGVSAQAGAFTEDILKIVAKAHERPIVFALSNPTIKAECTSEFAITHTDGRVLFSSGSPFPPVTYKGKTHRTGQGNNSYIFPGVALGVIAGGFKVITEEVFIVAANVAASYVTEKDLEDGCLYPPLSALDQISVDIAVKVIEYGFSMGLTTVYPKPEDIKSFVENGQYNFNYTDYGPKMWEWQDFGKK